MAQTRKLAAILAADVAGYSKLAGADEERTLARLRALRSDLIDPTIALHHGRVVKCIGDGVFIELSIVEAARCAIEMQNGMIERNTGVPPERRIEFRVGIHLGEAFWLRTVPKPPGEAPMSATGLPPKMAWMSAGGLDNQSIAFLNTPGIELLYSGVARSSPSAVAMACFNLVTDCGMPPLASRSPSYSGMPCMGLDL
jgi:Adenylate and Guanylate cyclase catalytic domain